jgi:hypothetical protein
VPILPVLSGPNIVGRQAVLISDVEAAAADQDERLPAAVWNFAAPFSHRLSGRFDQPTTLFSSGCTCPSAYVTRLADAAVAPASYRFQTAGPWDGAAET